MVGNRENGRLCLNTMRLFEFIFLCFDPDKHTMSCYHELHAHINMLVIVRMFLCLYTVNAQCQIPAIGEHHATMQRWQTSDPWNDKPTAHERNKYGNAQTMQCGQNTCLFILETCKCKLCCMNKRTKRGQLHIEPCGVWFGRFWSRIRFMFVWLVFGWAIGFKQRNAITHDRTCGNHFELSHWNTCLILLGPNIPIFMIFGKFHRNNTLNRRSSRIFQVVGIIVKIMVECFVSEEWHHFNV